MAERGVIMAFVDVEYGSGGGTINRPDLIVHGTVNNQNINVVTTKKAKKIAYFVGWYNVSRSYALYFCDCEAETIDRNYFYNGTFGTSSELYDSVVLSNTGTNLSLSSSSNTTTDYIVYIWY